MASHVSDTWQAMCVTHGMPCVNMHETFGHYIRAFIVKGREGEGGGKEKRKGGKERRKGGKEKRKGGKERRKARRKEKKKGEEERKKKEEKEGVLSNEQTRMAKNPELRYKR